jgi:hypothetical protein
MTRIRETIRVFVCTLREIFDEAAYTRFLQRTQMVSSPAAYASFWRERESSAPKPRCC